MPNIDQYLKTLASSDQLEEGYLNSYEERQKILSYLADNKNEIHLSKKRGLAKFSIILDQQGIPYTIYSPKVHDPKQTEPLAHGMHAVIKIAQRLTDGKWVAVKIQKGEYETSDVFQKNEHDQAEAEKQMLQKQNILYGYQNRLKQVKGKSYLYHYLFKEMLPGIPLNVYNAQKRGIDTLANHIDSMSKRDFLILYLNILTSLQELKNNGLIHRDLHGGNLLIDINDDYRVYIIDWGTFVQTDENGYWTGLSHTEPGGRFKIKFANGNDILNVLSELVDLGLQWKKNSAFETIFGNQYGDSNSLFSKAGKSDYNIYHSVDLQPYIDKIKLELLCFQSASLKI